MECQDCTTKVFDEPDSLEVDFKFCPKCSNGINVVKKEGFKLHFYLEDIDGPGSQLRDYYISSGCTDCVMKAGRDNANLLNISLKFCKNCTIQISEIDRQQDAVYFY